MSLVTDWLEAKETERKAIEARRFAEDAMVAEYRLNPQDDGTHTFEEGIYKVKISVRHTKKVDAELLQELAQEHGFEDILPHAFRWKPEIVACVWDKLEPEVRNILNDAITTTVSRPSFSIDKKEK